MEERFANSLTYAPLKGFENDFEISINSPYLIRNAVSKRVVSEWYNIDGIAAVELNGKLYLKEELVDKQTIK